jgi:SAM-dependent methyltransferase
VTTYYDTEAVRYDETRGGEPRAAAAAAAIESLLPAAAQLVLDVAGGTGIVGSKLRRTVFSVDRSAGMSRYAVRRLPGRVVLGDARHLPVAAGSVDVVTAVWLLHLLDETACALVIAEAVRVLRPGGLLVTTVDKAAAHRRTPDDVGEVLAALPQQRPSDGIDRLTGLGLRPVARTTFSGVGQGRSPRWWRDNVPEEVATRLAALPDQDRPRADPVFGLVAFSVQDVRRDDLLAQRHQ